uniref:Uncharacterized protein n=1 Tax=Arundo donax TaxID=35708 RepID=A0A0A9ATN7_ARUDO
MVGEYTRQEEIRREVKRHHAYLLETPRVEDSYRRHTNLLLKQRRWQRMETSAKEKRS